MEITRQSITSGITRTMDLPITAEEWAKYMGGALIQNAFPRLTAGQREFIKTGITDEEWNEMFPIGDEDEEDEEDEDDYDPDEDDIADEERRESEIKSVDKPDTTHDFDEFVFKS